VTTKQIFIIVALGILGNLFTDVVKNAVGWNDNAKP